MKDKKIENLKKRIWVDTICCFVIAGMCLIGIFSKIGLFVTIQRYAQKEPEKKVALLEEMAELLGGISGYVFIVIIFILFGLMLLNIRKKGRPFSKSNIRKVQAIAVLIIGCGVLPELVSSIILYIGTGNTDITYSVHEIFMMFMGSAMGILSEIFYYGNELQDDMDLIA